MNGDILGQLAALGQQQAVQTQSSDDMAWQQALSMLGVAPQPAVQPQQAAFNMGMGGMEGMTETGELARKRRSDMTEEEKRADNLQRKKRGEMKERLVLQEMGIPKGSVKGKGRGKIPEGLTPEQAEQFKVLMAQPAMGVQQAAMAMEGGKGMLQHTGRAFASQSQSGDDAASWQQMVAMLHSAHQQPRAPVPQIMTRTGHMASPDMFNLGGGGMEMAQQSQSWEPGRADFDPNASARKRRAEMTHEEKMQDNAIRSQRRLHAPPKGMIVPGMEGFAPGMEGLLK